MGATQSLETNLRIVALNPSVAYRIDDRLSVAAGVSLLRTDVVLRLALPMPPGGGARLVGDAWGVAGNVALLWRPLPEILHLALSYRSRSTQPVEGDADFTPATPGWDETFPDQPIRGNVNLPDVFTLGVMGRPLPALQLSADLNWVTWSQFNEVHVRFQRSPALDRRIGGSTVDPLTARAGAEWSFTALPIALRAGVSYDRSAASRETLSPAAPDGDRLSLCAGLGWDGRWWRVDVGYMHVHSFAAEAAGNPGQPEGTYRTSFRALATSLTVSLP